MSMMKEFFEIGMDKVLFDGLAILKERELCEEYMGKFLLLCYVDKNIASGGALFQTPFKSLKKTLRLLSIWLINQPVKLLLKCVKIL